MSMTAALERAGANAYQPLRGQTALVTGASSGIGAGVARSLSAAGAAVVVSYAPGQASAEAVAGEIRDAGGTAMAIRADVSREEDVQAMFGAIQEAWGRNRHPRGQRRHSAGRPG